jgi:hypothetical protein
MHGEKPQKRNWQDVPRPDPVRNLNAPVKFDPNTFSLRLPFVGEEAITKHMCRSPPFLRCATLHSFSDESNHYRDVHPVV